MEDDQTRLGALWALWKMLLRARDAVDAEALMPTQPQEWLDTVPMTRPRGEE